MENPNLQLSATLKSPTQPPKPLTISPERTRRIAYGFTNFDNYRNRALLYAGKPNWKLLQTLTPH